MLELMIRPAIYKYDTVKEFCEEISLGEDDLLLTGERTFEKYFRDMGLKCDVILRQRYNLNK